MSPSNRFRFLLIKWVIVLAASVALVIGFWPELLPLGVFVLFAGVAAYQLVGLMRGSSRIE
ncbi:MAG: hypothetical protein E7L00_09555 [Propionibacteriaceae bacterium]|nr:hypothetical protein [Propionibacteriaceae bacterium]